MKRCLLVLALMLASLISASTADAHVRRIPVRCTDKIAPRLCAIHFHHRRASVLHVKMGMARIPYAWTAEGHPARRTRLLTYWRHVHQRSVSRYAAWQKYHNVSATPVSSGLIADFNCISTKEEYGVSGTNTSAGYFGMIYAPSQYPSPGPELAAQYGDSWLDIPLSGQYQIAIAEQAKYGWSPWSTAGACGL